jgi:prephenate dehydrogenase
MKNEKIVVVGGKGRLGSWFIRYFSASGWQTECVDVDDTRTPMEIAKSGQIIFLAVPHPLAPKVIREVGVHLSHDQLLVDVSSVKSHVAEACNHLVCQLLLIHPMWSPQVSEMRGQAMIVCTPDITDHCSHSAQHEGHGYIANKLLKQFNQSGVLLNTTSVNDHDRIMALVQVATHATLLGLGRLYSASGFECTTLTACESPIYRMISAMIGRLLSHQPELYIDIALHNAHGPTTIAKLAQYINDISNLVNTANREELIKLFRGLHAYNEPGIESAVHDTAIMIQALATKLSS